MSAMKKMYQRIPAGVRAISIFEIVVSILLIILVIGYILFVRYDTSSIDPHTEGYGRAIGSILGFFIVIPFSILLLITAIALLKGKKWGRVLQLIISSSLIILSVIYFFMTFVGQLFIAIGLGLLPLIINGIILCYLFGSEKAKQVFS